jgi:hypothetical protein
MLRSSGLFAMLSLNARADDLDEDDNKGEYGQVYTAEVDGSNV